MGNIEETGVEALEFDDLYSQLSTSWETHQLLRMQGAPVVQLAESSIRLDRDRDAMWKWWSEQKRTVGI